MVQRGRSVVFECKGKHDPSLIPTMTWLKDDGELPVDDRSEFGFIYPASILLLILPLMKSYCPSIVVYLLLH